MNNNKIWLETASDLLEIQNKIKYLKTKQQMYAKILKELSGESGISLDGYKYAPIKRKGTVKYSDIPELMAVDLDAYRGKDVISWKLTFTQQFNI